MGISRRTLLVGAGAGAVAVVLAACTPEPQPTTSPTTAPPSPTPTVPPGAAPEPTAWMRSTWSTDAYSRGAMSYLPAGATPQLRTDPRGADRRPRVPPARRRTGSSRNGPGAIDAGGGPPHCSSPPRRAASVAVVGAGAAGAAAARALTDAGRAVTVFEARERTGGRIHSVADKKWPIPVQLGAWLSAGEDAGTLGGELAAQGVHRLTFDTPTGWSKDGAAPAVDEAPLRHAIEQAANAPADMPVDAALKAAGADPADPALAAALAWLQATTGADAEKASSWFRRVRVRLLVGADGDVGVLVTPL
jgi:hypothetical protein